MNPTATSRLPVVVIDPGHGGAKTVGGSSPNNAHGPPPDALLEKNLTLALARRLPALLDRDADVKLTRSDDRNLSLAARAAVAKSSGARVFVSIHFNGSADAKVDGTEVWVAKDATSASLSLARDLLQRVVAVTSVRDRGVRKEDFGVLRSGRHAQGTAVCLLEVAFLSNPKEAHRLRDTAYLDRLARAVADAIRQALSTPGSARSHGLELPHGLAEEYPEEGAAAYGQPGGVPAAPADAAPVEPAPVQPGVPNPGGGG